MPSGPPGTNPAASRPYLRRLGGGAAEVAEQRGRVGRCQPSAGTPATAARSIARASSSTSQPVLVISFMTAPPVRFLPLKPSKTRSGPSPARQREPDHERACQQDDRGERGPLGGVQVHRHVLAVPARQGEEDRADPGDAERHAQRVPVYL